MAAPIYQDDRLFLPDSEVIFSMLLDQVRISAGQRQPEPPAPMAQQMPVRETPAATAPAFDGSLLRSLALLAERVGGLQAGVALTEQWLREQTEREEHVYQEMAARVDGLARRVEHVAAHLETISAHTATMERRLMEQIDELRERLQRQEGRGVGAPPLAPQRAARRSARGVLRSLLTNTLGLG